MTQIHFVLQGKGGVGKSLVASLLAQYKIEQGHTPVCIDTDPVNATFKGYKALNVRRLEILSGTDIDSRNFDVLVELISSADDDFIIDNGASTFIPLSNYLIDNQIPSILLNMGRSIVIHTVITGGQAQNDTIFGFSQLVTQFPEETMFVIWLNPFWGTIEHEGKSFEHMPVYLKNKSRISGIIKIPEYKKETFGRDFEDLLQAKLTFDEAIANPALTIMNRQRLTQIKTGLFNLIENIKVL